MNNSSVGDEGGVPGGATAQLAAFVAELGYEDIPEDVRSLTQALLIDAFRAGLHRQSAPSTDRLRRSLLPIAMETGASVLFSSIRADPVRAAHLNGALGDEPGGGIFHLAAGLRPGAVVWAAALAAGEISGAAGRDVLTAVVAGSEVMVRLGRSVQPEHAARGFDPTATCGTLGAAAAAAKLLGLNTDDVVAAMGIAASYAGGLNESPTARSEIEGLHAGKAAAGGVEAALFAEAGLTGPHDIIEGRQGFCRATAGAIRLDPMLVRLGKDYHLRDMRMAGRGAEGGEAPVNGEEVVARFREVARDRFQAREIEDWLGEVEALETQPTIRSLLTLRVQEPAGLPSGAVS